MRARNLKPSVFKNDLLAPADPLYTLIFEGLWCMADREGRLEDKPVKIHIEVNPCRPFETTERSLTWLTENGFIVRYQVGQSRYIQVVTFKDHQNPHQKEPASKIPAPQASPGKAPGESGAGTGQAPVENKCGPADSGLLNPDSPSPIPVSLSPEASGTHEARGEGFAAIRAAYPAFTGRQDWISAQAHANNRIERDGLAWSDLFSAVERYRAYCDSGGVSGPQFVMTPAKFFSGADKPWMQEWRPPPSKAQVKQDRSVSATMQWLADEEAKDAAH
jgi:hypothetical protein